MTMVAACHLRDGAVIIADSRVTWKLSPKNIFSDNAQKIFRLDSKLAIAFAGNVDVACKIILQIHKKIAKDTCFRIPYKLATYLPRVARYFYQNYGMKKYGKCSVSLVFGGIDSSGRVSLWAYKSPLFTPHEIKDRFTIVGSGSIVASYLEKNYERINSTPGNLKSRTDVLIMELESELQKSGIVTVGGLFQVILLSSKGISPLKHGFMALTPEGPGNAKHIEIRAGKWVQVDSVKGKELELAGPAKILTSSPKEMRFHDYQAIDKRTLCWYLSYFLTCLRVNRDVDRTEFEGIISVIGSFHYPARVPILTSLGLWGPSGEHELIFRLDVEGEIKMIHKRAIHIEYFPEQVEVDTILFLEIRSPGPVFLECYIDGQFLSRKALYFGKLSESISNTKEECEVFIKQYPRLMEEKRAYTDSVLQKENCFLEYFILCQDVICEEGKYKFLGEMRAVYWKSYPLPLKLFIATAFRFSKGNHNIRIDLVNAATRETSKVASATVTSVADCLVVPVHGEVIAKIPKPGIYFFNLYVDNRLISSTVLPTESDEPEYSYSLMDKDSKSIASGELLVLSKRARQIK